MANYDVDDDLDVLPDFTIPANYTDSGLLLGMFKTRNAVEAGVLTALLAVIEYKLPFSFSAHLIIGVMTLLPTALFTLLGIDGDSFTERLLAIVKFFKNRRKMHMRRVGYRYAKEQLGSTARKAEKRRKK